jgi:hypothetical protein
VTFAAVNLPPGLTLDPATGTLSGTPTGPSPVCRVTASNPAGQSTFVDMAITVDSLRHSALEPDYPRGLAIHPVAPATPGEPGTTYAIHPALPDGLYLDPATGVISGTPTLADPAWQRVVTATRPGGSTTTVLHMGVGDGVRYAEQSAVYTACVPIQPNAPVHGTAWTATYTIAPDLPQGLHLDAHTGAITGIPANRVPGANYLVTATQPTGGTSSSLLAIAVHAFRGEAFNAGLARTDMLGNNAFGPALDLPTTRRTRQYGEYYPQAPILHAYHPSDHLRATPTAGVLACRLNLKFPTTYIDALPASIRNQIAALGLLPGQVDILCVSQDLPWEPGIPILLRPHYWTDPQAPMWGGYNSAPQVTVGIFEAPAGIQFQGHAPADFFSVGISVHPAQIHPQLPPMVVSSPNNLAIQGLDPAHSTSFWTLTRCGDRAAATLHLVLNDVDEAVMTGIAQHAVDLRDLFDRLGGSPLNGTRMVDQLRELTRPIVTQAAAGAPDGAGNRVLTLTGTGFSGASEVRVGAQVGHDLHVVGDTRITVTVGDPGTPAPQIVVTTPMGMGRCAYP